MAQHELEPEPKHEPIPIVQRILDDPFLLLTWGAPLTCASASRSQQPIGEEI